MNRNRLIFAEIQTSRPSMLHHHHHWNEKEIIDIVFKTTNVNKITGDQLSKDLNW